jgi:hypothetical protein
MTFAATEWDSEIVQPLDYSVPLHSISKSSGSPPWMSISTKIFPIFLFGAERMDSPREMKEPNELPIASRVLHSTTVEVIQGVKPIDVGIGSILSLG